MNSYCNVYIELPENFAGIKVKRLRAEGVEKSTTRFWQRLIRDDRIWMDKKIFFKEHWKTDKPISKRLRFWVE